MIPTDSPVRRELAERQAASKSRPRKAGKRPGKQNRPIARKRAAKSSSPLSSEEDDPVPLADSDASEAWEEGEEVDPPLVDPASLGPLARGPREGEYVLLKEDKSVGQAKKKKVTFVIGKAISNTTAGRVQLSLLKKSQKVKDKFLLHDPPEIKNVLVKSCVMLLPKPDISGTKRQQNHMSFMLDFSKVPFG